ncbi:peptidoglycan DD-metalloendopeptidase family protein [Campylobacter geochelonis]|uniref:M24/M37 family peptidase n=1 Tax=Campylobacter geochelonis TaxID=1780362 RepID=A0A128EQG3_9BACT|nr:peptidoglycan DD-metalloendopeptidase family protein [Campylobacter geochelonis]QKF71611.1 zinc metallopeptidase, M23 family [Campylobacter geochelonis]CZE48683.1 M24/M37 family peptidase [Campylobacter geochelonis]CZE48722.1 M24/M37 family peptidase [Campylobacter geochelonis]CZE51272.1 M24/M37 family peptidase [Campylobacter geochelonis]
MARKILFLFLFCCSVFGSGFTMEQFKWPAGVSFLKFLSDNEIPSSLYYDLSPEDQELTTEIAAEASCEVLKDEDGKIDQILIPISDELQIQIFKDAKNKYKIDFTPIAYNESTYTLGVTIENSPYIDINAATGNGFLANAFMLMFNKSVNFKNLRKGDQIALYYTQRDRLGQPFGQPQIISGMIEENGKSNYLYYFDSKYYDERGKMNEKFLFKLPIPGARVTSKFTPKRFHPVLKIYRAHLGTDYGAKKGTPIKAVGDGRVSFVGKKGGYGNTLEIQHVGGYKSLYAHLSKFAKGIKNGARIKQGEIVAYVGNTGLASGPHLHLGLYKNNKAMDFQKVVYTAKENIETKEKVLFQKFVKEQNQKLQKAIGGHNNPAKFVQFDNFIEL